MSDDFLDDDMSGTMEDVYTKAVEAEKKVDVPRPIIEPKSDAKSPMVKVQITPPGCKFTAITFDIPDTREERALLKEKVELAIKWAKNYGTTE